MRLVIQVVDLLVLGLFIFCVHRVFIRFEARRRFPLPPGPRGWPIIGNLFDYPRELPHIMYTEMGRKYQSDLLYLDMAGTSTLILNSAEAANDLLVGRSKFYSERPQFTMLSLVGWIFNLAFLPYGVKWRNYRSMFVREVSPSNLSRYHKPRIQEGMSVFLNRMLDTPQLFADHIHLLFGGALLSTAYGITIKDSDDYYLKLVKESMRAMAETATIGTYIVDIFPFLMYLPGWLPGIGFKKKAAQERLFVERMTEETFGFSKRNTKNSCIASRLSQVMQDEGTWSKENETKLKEILAVFYAAGTDTSALTAKTVILALVRNSSILKKGQAAVDAVIGLDRLPDYGDEGKIPYVDAIIMEALRWRAIVPTGVPHYTHSADIYLPKPRSWQIHGQS
jgi:cytochrome P450